METKELRRKLINDFGKFIQDDSKLEILESVFDAINLDEKKSIVSDSHYDLVSEEREKYLSGESQAGSWEEVENRLNAKYGFFKVSELLRF
ncbi:hypothetical protein ACHRV5_11335 [Flavobacterium sp. FlaQc-52]|jgi:hypothetical protein|uniref:hypothetical protein n=1 Tax=Flavobacterium sp. FlaQc-52 TaxID=3374185 RepID=UPI003756A816